MVFWVFCFLSLFFFSFLLYFFPFLSPRQADLFSLPFRHSPFFSSLSLFSLSSFYSSFFIIIFLYSLSFRTLHLQTNRPESTRGGREAGVERREANVDGRTFGRKRETVGREDGGRKGLFFPLPRVCTLRYARTYRYRVISYSLARLSTYLFSLSQLFSSPFFLPLPPSLPHFLLPIPSRMTRYTFLSLSLSLQSTPTRFFLPLSYGPRRAV